MSFQKKQEQTEQHEYNQTTQQKLTKAEENLNASKQLFKEIG